MKEVGLHNQLTVGCRKTQPREAIRRVLAESTQGLHPLEILSQAREFYRGASLATVHRTLKLLVATGEVRAVLVPGKPAAYVGVAAPDDVRFYCEGCRRVYCLKAGREAVLNPPAGFMVEQAVVFLYGRCGGCGKNEEGGLSAGALLPSQANDA